MSHKRVIDFICRVRGHKKCNDFTGKGKCALDPSCWTSKQGGYTPHCLLCGVTL